MLTSSCPRHHRSPCRLVPERVRSRHGCCSFSGSASPRRHNVQLLLRAQKQAAAGMLSSRLISGKCGRGRPLTGALLLLNQLTPTEALKPTSTLNVKDLAKTSLEASRGPISAFSRPRPPPTAYINPETSARHTPHLQRGAPAASMHIFWPATKAHHAAAAKLSSSYNRPHRPPSRVDAHHRPRPHLGPRQRTGTDHGCPLHGRRFLDAPAPGGGPGRVRAGARLPKTRIPVITRLPIRKCRSATCMASHANGQCRSSGTLTSNPIEWL